MKAQKIVIGALILMAIAYLLFAFVQMDFNARNWSQATRLGCALALLFGGWLGAFLAFIIDVEENQ